MRQEFHVSWDIELRLMNHLRDRLLATGLNASNTVIVTVSTDYAAVVGQYLRHQLTEAGEICVGFGVDVPYPDQTFDAEFTDAIHTMCQLHHDSIGEKTLLLVEAGVIRGGNYATIVEMLNAMYPKTHILTLTLFENLRSRWKSDFVGQYYDDTTQDLTFWWEKPNNHWTPKGE
jgi:hypothetical protein